MPQYIVTANRHRVTKKVTENGETRTVSTRYKRGDTISLPADEAERLVRSGGLRPVDQEGEAGLRPGSRLPESTLSGRVESPGALSGQTAEEGLREAGKPTPEALEAHAAAQEAAAKAREAFNAAQDGEDEADEPADEEKADEDEDDGYDALEYSDLQAECKKRDLPHTGKKADLVARLRENDQA